MNDILLGSNSNNSFLYELISAIKNNNLNKVKFIQKYCLNIFNKDIGKAMMLAIMLEYTDIVDFMMENSGNYKFISPRNETILTYAIKENKIKMISHILNSTYCYDFIGLNNHKSDIDKYPILLFLESMNTTNYMLLYNFLKYPFNILFKGNTVENLLQCSLNLLIKLGDKLSYFHETMGLSLLDMIFEKIYKEIIQLTNINIISEYEYKDLLTYYIEYSLDINYIIKIIEWGSNYSNMDFFDKIINWQRAFLTVIDKNYNDNKEYINLFLSLPNILNSKTLIQWGFLKALINNSKDIMGLLYPYIMDYNYNSSYKNEIYLSLLFPPHTYDNIRDFIHKNNTEITEQLLIYFLDDKYDKYDNILENIFLYYGRYIPYISNDLCNKIICSNIKFKTLLTFIYYGLNLNNNYKLIYNYIINKIQDIITDYPQDINMKKQLEEYINEPIMDESHNIFYNRKYDPSLIIELINNIMKYVISDIRINVSFDKLHSIKKIFIPLLKSPSESYILNDDISFLSKKYSDNFINDINDTNYLIIASYTGSFSIIKYWYDINKEELLSILNKKDNNGYTPLHYAVKYSQNPYLINFLINIGAKLNISSSLLIDNVITSGWSVSEYLRNLRIIENRKNNDSTGESSELYTLPRGKILWENKIIIINDILKHLQYNKNSYVSYLSNDIIDYLTLFH
jgi:ankyrin repeat protein